MQEIGKEKHVEYTHIQSPTFIYAY